MVKGRSSLSETSLIQAKLRTDTASPEQHWVRDMLEEEDVSRLKEVFEEIKARSCQNL
jgi:ethanolamine utilization protein EutQ (cupin superfamily)